MSDKVNLDTVVSFVSMAIETLKTHTSVCICGCPNSEHESYGEDGEGCGEPYHECLRCSPAVLSYIEELKKDWR